MEIEFKRDASFKGTDLPKGRYYVGLLKETSQLSLTGLGLHFIFPAVRRPLRKKLKVSEVELQPGIGSKGWTLYFRSPPHFEYFLVFHLADPRAQAKRRRQKLKTTYKL